MHDGEVFIAVSAILIGLPIICVTILCLVRILKGGGSKKQQALDAEEARLIQEIHSDMTRLENRIESIETLVLEREQTRKKSE
jgi:phage shock protein B